MKLIKRQTTDPNFEHCAKTLLPFGIEAIRALGDGDRLNSDMVNVLGIVAEVAQAFAEREYGKPRFRVPATSIAP